MGLSLALNTARSALLATSSQIAVASRNIAGANDAAYARKIATLVTAGGSATVVIGRATDAALFVRKLSATSAAAERDAVLGGLQTLAQTVGDTSDATSPASRLGALNAALQAAANQPDDADLARTAVTAAGALADSLNAAAETVHGVRADADAAMATSVATINDLLARFDVANRAVIKGTAVGGDVTDDLDDRDRILNQLSEEIGITTVPRSDGGLSVYTDGGVPLFERTARTVSFQATAAYGAGAQGASVIVDGVPVTGSASPMPLGSGRLAGLAALRDTVAVQYEAQIDAVAGGLIDAFAESDAAAPDAGARAGLFTGAGSAVPAAGAAGRQGLATLIRVNAAVDPTQGGDVTLLRDGGMNGAAYSDNSTAEAGYSGRLRALTDALGAARDFETGGDLSGQATLADFTASSAGWLEARRQDASTQADYQKTLLSRATDALSNAVGVSGDDETALTLRLEQSYTASAKLMAVVNDLLKTLLDTVR